MSLRLFTRRHQPQPATPSLRPTPAQASGAAYAACRAASNAIANGAGPVEAHAAYQAAYARALEAEGLR